MFTNTIVDNRSLNWPIYDDRLKYSRPQVENLRFTLFRIDFQRFRDLSVLDYKLFSCL